MTEEKLLILEKQRRVIELDIVNICNKLSEPSRRYLLDCYVQLSFEDFARVFIAYLTGYINGREEITAMWKESLNEIAKVVNR